MCISNPKVMLNGDRLVFPTKERKKARHLTVNFNMVLQILANSVRQEENFREIISLKQEGNCHC